MTICRINFKLLMSPMHMIDFHELALEQNQSLCWLSDVVFAHNWSAHISKQNPLQMCCHVSDSQHKQTMTCSTATWRLYKCCVTYWTRTEANFRFLVTLKLVDKDFVWDITKLQHKRGLDLCLHLSPTLSSFLAEPTKLLIISIFNTLTNSLAFSGVHRVWGRGLVDFAVLYQ